jgi:glucose-6-phosphate 1-dehydrogenase
VLLIHVQPNEGVSLAIGAKVPGQGMTIRTVHMDFLYGGTFREGLPDAYERLILDAMLGDATLFTRSDEIEEQWALVDAITGTLERHDPGAPVLPYLLSGGTDNKALSILGIKGYGFAPLKLPADMDFAAMFHGVDERVPLDALVFGRRVLSDLLLNY